MVIRETINSHEIFPPEAWADVELQRHVIENMRSECRKLAGRHCMMIPPNPIEFLRVEFLAYIDGQIKNVVQENGEMVSVLYQTTATA